MPKLPSQEDVAYMLAHASDSLIPDIIACTSICGVAATVFLILRLYCQWLTPDRKMARLADWFMVIAWVFFITFDIVFASTTRYGGGRHILFASDTRLLQILNISNENLYLYAMAFIKFSILTLYGTIFPSRPFHYCLWTVASVVGAWAISLSFVAIFQCTPIAYGWDIAVTGGYCLNYGLAVLIAGVVNIITDFTILLMPIPLILKLHVNKRKKRLLIFTFCLGGSACVVSIIRLAFALKVGTTADGSWDNIPAGLLSVVELMTGILVASIPRYRILWQKVTRGSLETDKDPLTAESTITSRSKNHGVAQPSISASAGNFCPETGSGINVTRQIEMVTYPSKGGDKWVRVPDDDNLNVWRSR